MNSPDACILYADDDADSRELVTVLLESHNCQVIAIESAGEALRLARAEHFDLYLIDYWMPGTSGVVLCEQLREFDQHTPVLFFSGAAFETDKKRALESGAQGYLVKPVDGDQLVTVVLRLIADSRQSRPLSATGKNPDLASPAIVFSSALAARDYTASVSVGPGPIPNKR
ncbi:MAG: DNA-binding response regulator [Acidobacteria bacterium]|nr:DNA-binding response regulator [Acidobacteriota bacterium]